MNPVDSPIDSPFHLEPLKFGIRKIVSEHECLIMGKSTLKQYVDFMTRDMVLEMTTKILGRKLRTKIYSRPASWWDHFKAEVLSQIFPGIRVHWIDKEVSVWEIFPDYEVPKGLRTHVILNIQEGP